MNKSATRETDRRDHSEMERQHEAEIEALRRKVHEMEQAGRELVVENAELKTENAELRRIFKEACEICARGIQAVAGITDADKHNRHLGATDA